MPDLERKQTSGIEDPRYMLTLKDGFIRPAIRYGRMEEPVSFHHMAILFLFPDGHMSRWKEELAGVSNRPSIRKQRWPMTPAKGKDVYNRGHLTYAWSSLVSTRHSVHGLRRRLLPKGSDGMSALCPFLTYENKR